ncbi:MAG: repressor LexA [Chloroflexi bacterium]|nr:repressor LexA [Chloroflexota bacterium]|tara:strand:- start:2551 stop:3189 length:639 start_codon:yes stop_codon:yes gene_type:complete
MLSERQQDILNFINQFLVDEGFPPTIREIQKSCNISSTSVVSYNIEALKKKGYLEHKSNKSRGIVNNQLNKGQLISIPLIGIIAAGEPLEIPEDINIDYEEEIEIPIDWFPKNKNIFALEVKGDSMTGDMISDGDVIIAEKIVDPNEINSNHIGVIKIIDENSGTLKRISFNKDKNEVKLIPSNPEYLPITQKASNIKIEGKVLGLLRSFNT